MSPRPRVRGIEARVGAGRANRDGVDARVTAVVRGRRQTQEVSGGQSYLSAPEKTLTFGLGGSAKMDSLEIRWPDGTRETRRDTAPGAAVVFEQKAAGSRR